MADVKNRPDSLLPTHALKFARHLTCFDMVSEKPQDVLLYWQADALSLTLQKTLPGAMTVSKR